MAEPNYIKLSGGLPHSEICGSKPILGSPQLIAEYHVLHRLLLPRHPPNALLALDLIQKKTGFRLPGPAGSSGHILLNQKHTFPLFPFGSATPEVIRPIAEREEHSHVSMLKRDLVSVLDLEISCLMVDPKISAIRLCLTRRSHMKSDVYLSIRCQ